MIYCWFCEQEKDSGGLSQATTMAYGHPFPLIELSVRPSLYKVEDGLDRSVCPDCLRDILYVLAESRVASKEHVQSEKRIADFCGVDTSLESLK